MNYSGIYKISQKITITTTLTLLQIKAGATTPFELIRASVTNASVETSDTMHIQLLRKSSAATVTALTPLLLRPSDAAADAVGGTAATGHTASVEGTDTDVLDEEGVNVLNGYHYLPVPEERPIIVGAGFIALRSVITIASTDLVCVMVFGELA